MKWCLILGLILPATTAFSQQRTPDAATSISKQALDEAVRLMACSRAERVNERYDELSRPKVLGWAAMVAFAAYEEGPSGVLKALYDIAKEENTLYAEAESDVDNTSHGVSIDLLQHVREVEYGVRVGSSGKYGGVALQTAGQIEGTDIIDKAIRAEVDSTVTPQALKAALESRGLRSDVVLSRDLPPDSTVVPLNERQRDELQGIAARQELADEFIGYTLAIRASPQVVNGGQNPGGVVAPPPPPTGGGGQLVPMLFLAAFGSNSGQPIGDASGHLLGPLSMGGSFDVSGTQTSSDGRASATLLGNPPTQASVTVSGGTVSGLTPGAYLYYIHSSLAAGNWNQVSASLLTLPGYTQGPSQRFQYTTGRPTDSDANWLALQFRVDQNGRVFFQAGEPEIDMFSATPPPLPRSAVHADAAQRADSPAPLGTLLQQFIHDASAGRGAATSAQLSAAFQQAVRQTGTNAGTSLPPTAGLGAQLTALHGQLHGVGGTTDAQPLETWFHSSFCHGGTGLSSAQLEALHQQWHKILGVPENAPGMQHG